MELEISLVNPKETALLVIDVQNDFIHEKGGMAGDCEDMSHSQNMVPKLLKFIDAARDQQLPIIYTQATRSKWTHSASWRRILPAGAREDVFCNRGTWGWDFYHVAPKPDELVIQKARFSAFIGTHLEMTLRALAIKNVLVTGVVTGGCVQMTAMHAFMLDFNVVVVSDCCADSSETTHSVALQGMGRFLTIGTAPEIKKIWGRVGGKV